MPKLGAMTSSFAIVRSMQAWALVHSLAQTWTQIGRNPAGVLGNVSPNIGSVVAIEKDAERTPCQVFPTFLALNSAGAAGPGYFPADYAPFKVTPSNSGIKNTTNPDGQTRFDTRWSFLHQIDDPLRVNSPDGQPMSDYDQFYSAAMGMMYNPVVTSAFNYSAADATRYGNTGFGNACILAKQVSQPTRERATSRSPSAAGTCIRTFMRRISCRFWPDNSTTAFRPDRRPAGFGRFRRHHDRDGGRIRPHCGPAHRRQGPRSPAAAVRVLRRRGRQRRQSDRGYGSHRRRPRPTPAGRAIASSSRKISRPPSTPPWGLTGLPSATTIRWAAASTTCRTRIRISTVRSTNFGSHNYFTLITTFAWLLAEPTDSMHRIRAEAAVAGTTASTSITPATLPGDAPA